MFDAIVIGGGPIGLNTAIELGQKNKSVLLLESSDTLGGQLTALYPEKEIVDIDGFESIKAKDYIQTLITKVKQIANIEVHLEEIVKEVVSQQVITNLNSYQAKDIFICIGLGRPTPRKMGLKNENSCQNILYNLKDLTFLKDKTVLVLGGGDSALDWTKIISQISNNVTIIHRRREFRGNFDTIKDLKNVIIKTPYIPFEIIKKDDKLVNLVIENVENKEHESLPADYVFVNYGNIPVVNTFSLETMNNGIVVNKDFLTNLPHIYALGDIARYENKKNRIQPGLNELKHIINLID